MIRIGKFKLNNLLTFIIKWVFLLGVCYTVLYPLIFKAAIALRSKQDLIDSSIYYIPKHFSLDAFFSAFDLLNKGSTFFNTFSISILSSIAHVIACTITAYSLARFTFPFKRLVYVAVITTFFVPPQLLSFPIHIIFKNLDVFNLLSSVFSNGINLLNRPISLILLYGTANALKSGFFIYLLIQFFRNLPKELDEAASVDGAGLIRTFTQVILPNSVTMLVTVFLFTFVWQWTDLQYTSMFFIDYDLLSIKLSVIGKTYQMYMDGVKEVATPLMVSQIVNAASIIFVIPLLFVYTISNRFFVQGLEHSGIVG